jgi:hypothetical protein
MQILPLFLGEDSFIVTTSLSSEQKGVCSVEKSLYFVVSWADAKQYSDALKKLGIEHIIETPEEIPSLVPGELAFVFPSLPVRVYAKVRTLFSHNGKRY